MSAHTKTHLTKVAVGNKKFNLPIKEAKTLLSFIKYMSNSRTDTKNNYVGWPVVFSENFKNIPEWAVCLRAARHKNQLSQKKLSEKAQIPITTLSKYENGERKISEKQAHKLAKVLKIPYLVLLPKNKQ